MTQLVSLFWNREVCFFTANDVGRHRLHHAPGTHIQSLRGVPDSHQKDQGAPWGLRAGGGTR